MLPGRNARGMVVDRLLEEPELRPFLPLLYLAWADGNMGLGERELIQARITAQPWLKPRLRVELERWLDGPAPKAAALAQLRSAIANSLGTLSPRGRRSLASLAESMARLEPATRAALDQLEKELGVDLAELGPLQAELEFDATHPPSFDVRRLQRLLDGRFAAARDEARRFLAEPEHRALYGVDKETHRRQVFEWLGELSRRGLGRVAFPGVTCGAEEGLGPFLTTFETLGYGDLSLVIKYGVQFGLWGGSVYFLGSDEQRQEYLPRVASLEFPGCFAMSEVGHGSNVADLETLVRYDAERGVFVLHTPAESARKDWAGNAALHARFATVFAQLEVAGDRQGVHAFVVPIRDEQGQPLPGIRVGDSGHKLGLNGVDNGRLWFDQVELPREALLSRYAEVGEDGRYSSPIQSPSQRFFTMLGTLVGGRIAVAASGLSAAKLGLTIALRYATTRRQFGPTSEPETLLLDYPSHQRRLLPHLATSFAFHFALDEVRERFLAEGEQADRRELEAEVAGLKAATTWHVSRTLQACREACGGQGYLAVNRIADARADTDVFTTFEGDNTVLVQLLAKGLLAGFQRRWAERGGVRYIADHLSRAFALTNPVTSRGSDEATLRDAVHQLEILEYREATLLHAAARRIRKRKTEGMEATRILHELQEHLLVLGQAHVDVVSHRAFSRAVDKAEGAERRVLDRLRALYGLLLFEANAAWYLESGTFEAARARSVRKLVPRLFAELRPDVVGLTDAFGIPDVCLAAPIAFHDPAHPRW